MKKGTIRGFISFFFKTKKKKSKVEVEKIINDYEKKDENLKNIENGLSVEKEYKDSLYTKPLDHYEKKDFLSKLDKGYIEKSFFYDSKDNQIRTKSNNILTKIIIFLFLIFSTIFTYFLWNLPDYRVLGDYNPYVTTRVYSEDGNLFSEISLENRLYVPIHLIPESVKNAFISAEDQNFYSHFGIDIYGLARATYRNIQYILGENNTIEGASTITQQVVKNLLLNHDRTIRRKVREAILTLKVEREFSKDYILELYLNEIYLGRSAYGVSKASLLYFDKSITDLNLQEAAFLASLPKAPSRYDPRFHYDRSKERRDWVISRILEDDKITPQEALYAIASPIDYADSNKRKVSTNYFSYASEEVRRELIDVLGHEKIYNGGLVVKTTIRDDLQRYANRVLRKGIIQFDNRQGYRGPLVRLNKSTDFLNEINKETSLPNWLVELKNNSLVSQYKNLVTPWKVAIVITTDKNSIEVGLLDNSKQTIHLSDNRWARDFYSTSQSLNSFTNILQDGDIIFLEQEQDKWFLRQIPQVNGALVAMNPQTGAVLAMQGGFSFSLSQFNRVTQARRQPGSALKPFVYLSAIENNLKTTDKVLDAPIVMDSEDRSWRPKNYANSYGGLVTLRNSIERSRNLSTVRIAQHLGLNNVSKTIMRTGLYDEPLKNYSEVLGSKEVTLLNLVNSYSSLVNGGKEVSPNLITQVQDYKGEIVYSNDNRDCHLCDDVSWSNQKPPELEDTRKNIIDERDAAIVVDLLKGVVQRGTGIRARVAGYNIGGKTGTTNDVKDAWFVGFTPDLVVGIYFGQDIPKELGDEVGATRIVVPVFSEFMKYALQSREQLPFRTPEGLEMRWINYATGESGTPGDEGVILEVFKQGSSSGQRVIVDDGTLQDLNNQSFFNDEGIY